MASGRLDIVSVHVSLTAALQGAIAGPQDASGGTWLKDLAMAPAPMTPGFSSLNNVAPVPQPWVALIYSAVEPAGNRGGGIHNAVIAQATGLMANGIGVKILTASEACAAEARTRGIPVEFDLAWRSGVDPVFSMQVWRNRFVAPSGARIPPAAVIHNNGRTWLAGAFIFPGILNAQVLHRETIRPYRFFRNWIALSEPFAAELRQTWSGRLRRIAVAPNGLAAKPAEPPPRKAAGPVIFGTAGRISGPKGVDTLFDAAELLARDGADVRLRWAGPEHEAAPYRLKAESRGIQQIVEFIGWVDDIDGFLDSIDVFCLPSSKESFGLVLIEAMARRVPVIATATNGARDVVRPGETGWLVPIDDPAALADTLRDVAGDRAEIARRAASAYQDVHARFTPVTVGRRMIEALVQLGAPLTLQQYSEARRTPHHQEE